MTSPAREDPGFQWISDRTVEHGDEVKEGKVEVSHLLATLHCNAQFA